MSRPEVIPLISPADIQSRVTELSRAINEWLGGQPVVAVCVLKSGFVFYSDVVRQLQSEVHCDFVGTASPETLEARTGEITITVDSQVDVSGKNVLLIDDIVGTGLTLGYYLRLFRGRNARAVKTCALATKQKKSVISLSVDFVGFTLEDRFFVGYGMDYCGWFRELPFIGTIHK